MNFMERGEWVAAERNKAKLKGCCWCHRITEVGIKAERSLSNMHRSGSSVEEMKEAIKKDGWYCRSCVHANRRMLENIAAGRQL